MTHPGRELLRPAARLRKADAELLEGVGVHHLAVSTLLVTTASTETLNGTTLGVTFC